MVIGLGFVEKWLKIFIREIILHYREINSIYRGYIFDYREIMNMHIKMLSSTAIFRRKNIEKED
ncbi:hypothetical protein [Fictibacillus sp. JL2B1089]|uniref:hypothetical protein n=1 Tax=Fictibacillus sp. JL2B1089 TaxID=3399565 RepID=UPI003A87E1F3